MKPARLAFMVREDGIALVMALVFMAVLLTVGGTVTYYATTNTRDAAFQAGNQRAFSAAEAGLNEGIAVLANAGNPTLSSTLPSSEATAVTDASSVNGSTIRYWATYDSGTLTWTVYGKGTTPAPNSTSRTVQQQIRIGAGGATVAGNPAWGTIFADNKNGSCFNLSSNSKIAVPMYVTGNLCLSSGGQVQATASPLTVEATVDINTSNASIGQSSAHLSDFHSGGGCRFGGSGAYTFPCTTTQKVWVDHQDQVLAGVTKPPINLTNWYANAKPGPQQGCTSGSSRPASTPATAS